MRARPGPHAPAGMLASPPCTTRWALQPCLRSPQGLSLDIARLCLRQPAAACSTRSSSRLAGPVMTAAARTTLACAPAACLLRLSCYCVSSPDPAWQPHLPVPSPCRYMTPTFQPYGGWAWKLACLLPPSALSLFASVLVPLETAHKARPVAARPLLWCTCSLGAPALQLARLRQLERCSCLLVRVRAVVLHLFQPAPAARSASL